MKTVLLDLFGVACPEGHFHKNILLPMFKNSLEAQVEKSYQEVKFGVLEEREFWGKFGWGPAEGRETMLRGIRLDPKLREVVAYLKRRNYAVVLFSDFPRIWLDELAKQRDLQLIFDRIVSAPHMGYRKSDPRLYSEAKRQFGECVMVDDHVNWLAIANKAGIETVWKKNAEEATSYEPDHVIRYLEELKAVL